MIGGIESLLGYPAEVIYPWARGTDCKYGAAILIERQHFLMVLV